MSASRSVEILEGDMIGQVFEDRSGDGHSDRLRILAGRLTILIVGLGLWEGLAGRVVPTLWVSRPSDIADRLAEWLTNGYLLTHLFITLEETALGFAVGASAAIVVGLILGRNAFLARLLDPFLTAVYSLPKIALAPLFVLWFGIGFEMKVVMAATIVFFLVFWNTYGGVRDVDPELVDILRVLGASPRQVVMKVVLPSALPWIYTGLKLAVPYALIGAIVGEMIASNRGLGYVLAYASGRFDTTGLFAGLFVLTVISATMNEVLNRTERRLLRWKRSAES